MTIAKKRVLLLVSILVFSIFTGVFPIENCIASGNTIYVDDDYDSSTPGWQVTHFDKIQDGINAVLEHGTVHVYSGTYNENIFINKPLNLIRAYSTSRPVINGVDDHAQTIEVSLATNVNISGFEIHNAVGKPNNYKGIYIDSSDYCEITDCYISDAEAGIWLRGNNCNVSSCKIYDNNAEGIYLFYEDNNRLSNNTINNNREAIKLCQSDNNIIADNHILHNTMYGVYIIQSTNNRFYFNDFTDNGQNAQDPLTNYWSYNSRGNYWDDYNDYDSDEDGIGDSPYDIPGGSNQDVYPLGYFLEPEPPSGGNQQPTAHLPIISPNPATYGETVTFSGSGSDSDGYIVGYNWRSSIDGQLNTQSTFSTSSLSTGTHVIYFKVKDNDGDWSSERTATLIINLTENRAPTAYIDSITPNPAKVGETVYFIGHGTDNGEITEWKWISSIDGVISSDESFDSSNLSTDTHAIYFQVRDNDNKWSKQATETLTINDGSYNHLPVANAGGPYSCYANMEIDIDGSDSYDDGSIVDYLWDFGDGTIGTGESPTHIYTASGNYSITLTVLDEYGDTSTDSTYVVIAQSTNQSGGSEGLLGFELEVPFPLVVVFELIFIIAIIALFLFWIKRK